MARVRWGVLSTASTGRLVMEATRAAGHAEFVAVASRDADRCFDAAEAAGRHCVEGLMYRHHIDPDGTLGLTDPEHDVYRVEVDTVSASLAAGEAPPFGRADAVAQARTLQALYRSADDGTPVDTWARVARAAGNGC
jgi:predicted dehydrogenase